ncbi:glycosyltransferase family 15 protein [Armillaria gallica]|uniref:Glycosyltransferase family 15 protein n=1 Tax=Armillaria gallica TaxID=47427 RepID=A0A2H3DZK9_ARMGA|nr:glycosyltransferase family 15 protein [Armillaria gallica]
MYLPMMTPRRYITVVLVLVISIHYILSIAFEDYKRISSLSNWGSNLHVSEETTQENGSYAVALPDMLYHNATERANATFVLLARNSDINGVVSSMQSVEDRFNKHYNYPWVLLNDEPFTDSFKERVSIITRAPISFGLIPKEHWVQPDWIDEDRARLGRQKMMAQRIIYAGELAVALDYYLYLSYRNMCRFNSGFFFHHELLQPYRYYWRPDVKFFCDINYDPFVYMREHDKVYSFTISLTEWAPTIPTLWSTVKEFIATHPDYIDPHNAMDYLSNDGGDSYNLCHFWSNFEIADMDFWRSDAYQAFFDFLESKGGFYYERWGDAPVHSIAAALFARRDQIHFFRDIGYRHESFQHCPQGDQWSVGRCSCDPADSFDYSPNSCVRKFENLFS